jgi:hypothetical protein
MAPRLAEALAPRAELVAAPLAALEGAQWPDDLQFMRDRLLDVGRQTVALVNAFVDAAGTPHDPIGLYRAMRRFALWHRLLGRPAAESGRLRHGEGPADVAPAAGGC